MAEEDDNQRNRRGKDDWSRVYNWRKTSSEENLSTDSDDTVRQTFEYDCDEDSDYIDIEDELEDSPIDYIYSNCKHRKNIESVIVKIPLLKLRRGKELQKLTTEKSSNNTCEELVQHLKKREKDGLKLTLIKSTEANNYQIKTRSKDKILPKITITKKSAKDPCKSTQKNNIPIPEIAVKNCIKINKNETPRVLNSKKHRLDDAKGDIPQKCSKLNDSTITGISQNLIVSDALLSFEGLKNSEALTVNNAPQQTHQHLPMPENQPATVIPPDSTSNSKVIILGDRLLSSHNTDSSQNNIFAVPKPVNKKPFNKPPDSTNFYDVRDERFRMLYPHSRRYSVASTASNATQFQEAAAPLYPNQEQRRFSTFERPNRKTETQNVLNTPTSRRNLLNSFNSGNGTESTVNINIDNRRPSVSSTTPATTPLKIKNHFQFEPPNVNRVALENQMRYNNHNALWRTAQYNHQFGHPDMGSGYLFDPIRGQMIYVPNQYPQINHFAHPPNCTKNLRNFRRNSTAVNQNMNTMNQGANMNFWYGPAP